MSDSEHNLGKILHHSISIKENKSECNCFENFRVCVNTLQLFKVEVIGTVTIDIRLPLIEHHGSTRCFNSCWLLQIIFQLPLVLLKTRVEFVQAFCHIWVNERL